MSILLMVLGVLAALAGIGCFVFILIDAFQDEVWKGVVCLLCGLYFLFYALFEFEHENKWLIVLGWLFSSSVSIGLFRTAGVNVPD
ncbi:MAG: hypothetical protein HYR64_09760 [Fimbriimonas ginsengisoli]|uniref:Uncharacterized protein n=1 Tax=Fimbriimonas ginsengisoli TaxID=1005039 RepID=A0A931PV88_FIMGI|nr:hypothetical protein [Fimbriimonas ginsengisoli]